jgi:hypothetical protein
VCFYWQKACRRRLWTFNAGLFLFCAFCVPVIAVTYGLSGREVGCSDDGVEAIGDGAVALVASVEVDQGSAGGAMSHAVHELAQGGSGFRGERVAGVP